MLTCKNHGQNLTQLDLSNAPDMPGNITALAGLPQLRSLRLGNDRSLTGPVPLFPALSDCDFSGTGLCGPAPSCNGIPLAFCRKKTLTDITKEGLTPSSASLDPSSPNLPSGAAPMWVYVLGALGQRDLQQRQERRASEIPPAVIRNDDRDAPPFAPPASAFAANTNTAPLPVYERPPARSGDIEGSTDLRPAPPARGGSMLKVGFAGGGGGGSGNPTGGGVSMMTVTSVTAPPTYRASASILPHPTAVPGSYEAERLAEPTPPNW
ncbi:hypothetical protein HK101_003126 [Irineochytrium annulatum]|nr:hypothetical protein HK101_003126 [Irineochytrium annulatum]